MTADTVPKRKPGRPRILPAGGKRLTVTLDVASYAKAEALGAGNVNAGIRAALAGRCERMTLCEDTFDSMAQVMPLFSGVIDTAGMTPAMAANEIVRELSSLRDKLQVRADLEAKTDKATHTTGPHAGKSTLD